MTAVEDRSASEFLEELKFYYARLFPYDTYHKWLAYEHEGGRKSFPNREFSFTMPGDIYIRFNSFEDKKELMLELQKNVPIKIDIGAEYNNKPDKAKSKMIYPVKRELVFDIDMTDYDTVRKCCKEGSICEKCWKFMQIAVKILDTSLREDFNFHHLLWVYSGRRGIHCWVCDKEARALNSRARTCITEYLSIIPLKTQKKKFQLYQRQYLHNAIIRAVKIIEKYFVDVCVKDQDILGGPDDIKTFLSYMHDENFAKELEKRFNDCNSSLERWEAFLDYLEEVKKGDNSTNRPNMMRMKHIKEEIMVLYAYPRLDINVTKGLKHLLKSPFCVHPKTGRVCVPFNPNAVDKFDPFKVPNLSDLLRELNEFDAKLNPEIPSFSISTLKDGRKTSLIKALVVFEQFVSKLERLKGGPPKEENENLDEAIEES